MRAFVFTDKALARHAGQFVWLSIDTEKPGNASFLTKFPVEVWPSFFVVDSRSEKVALRWVGGASVGQVVKILDDARLAIRGREKGVEEILARADRFYSERKNADAVREYREAVRKPPFTKRRLSSWPRDLDHRQRKTQPQFVFQINLNVM